MDLCQQAERAGVNLITVHGRTPAERTQPVHADAYPVIRDALSIPLWANGDVTSREGALQLARDTGVHGWLFCYNFVSFSLVVLHMLRVYLASC